MKSFTVNSSVLAVVAVVVLFLSYETEAFTASSVRPKALSSLNAKGDGYVPSGMTPAQWKKLKQEEEEKKKKLNLARIGPRGFKSRSLQSFQEDLESGKVGHLLPVLNSKQLLKLKSIKLEDIPYMQRGGAWDDSDIKGAKKKAWSPTDMKYQEEEENGSNKGVDWTGLLPRQGPVKKKAAPSKAPKKAPKKFLGLF